MPTLSVVMPNFNHARYLPQALDAILGQSLRAAEVIVIDDGSTDDSLAVLREYARRDVTVRVLPNDRNRGCNYSVRRGLEACSGDYVLCASADDLVLPGLFAGSMELLTRHPTAGLCSALTREIGDDGAAKGQLRSVIPLRRPGYLAPAQVRETLHRMGLWVATNTTIFRKAALLEAGGFRPELGSFADGFAVHAIALKHGACFIPRFLGARRWLETGMSAVTHRDPAAIRRVGKTAAALMRGPYRDLFPPGYASRWLDGILFGAAWVECEQLRARARQAPGRDGRIATALGRTAAGVRWSLKAGGAVVRHFPAEILRRRLHQALQSRFFDRLVKESAAGAAPR